MTEDIEKKKPMECPRCNGTHESLMIVKKLSMIFMDGQTDDGRSWHGQQHELVGICPATGEKVKIKHFIRLVDGDDGEDFELSIDPDWKDEDDAQET